MTYYYEQRLEHYIQHKLFLSVFERIHKHIYMKKAWKDISKELTIINSRWLD